MKYEVTFAMCHCETTVVELDIKNKTKSEIRDLVEQIAWQQIRKECTDYDPEEVVEILEVEED